MIASKDDAAPIAAETLAQLAYREDYAPKSRRMHAWSLMNQTRARFEATTTAVKDLIDECAGAATVAQCARISAATMLGYKAKR